MMSQRYTLVRVRVLPLAKFGVVVGASAMLLPGLLCGGLTTQAIAAARLILGDWESARLDDNNSLLPLELNVIELLGLELVQAFITQLHEQQLIVWLIVLLTFVLGGAILVGGTIVLMGWVYNILAWLTGGLELELQEHAVFREVGSRGVVFSEKSTTEAQSTQEK